MGRTWTASELVVGGEPDRSAWPLDYAWVRSIREQCLRHGVHFEFRQCGTHFVKVGKIYRSRRGICAARPEKRISSAEIQDAFGGE